MIVMLRGQAADRKARLAWRAKASASYAIHFALLQQTLWARARGNLAKICDGVLDGTLRFS
ncbi:MAG: hypothetical protein ACR2JB_15130 [Bryobacteraceae bacterium]